MEWRHTVEICLLWIYDITSLQYIAVCFTNIIYHHINTFIALESGKDTPPSPPFPLQPIFFENAHQDILIATLLLVNFLPKMRSEPKQSIDVT